MKRGRKRREPIQQLHAMESKRRTPNVGVRFCFSRDGIFCGDGQFRWWQESDDSGYAWDGFFDILSKEQLKERIICARSVGIAVFEKIEYSHVDGHEAQEWEKYENRNGYDPCVEGRESNEGDAGGEHPGGGADPFA